MKAQYVQDNGQATKIFQVHQGRVASCQLINHLLPGQKIYEVEPFELSVRDGERSQLVKCTDLTVREVVEENQTVHFDFAPYEVWGAQLRVGYTSTMQSEAGYFSSTVELAVAGGTPNLCLDYLEAEQLHCAYADFIFSYPQNYVVPDTAYSYPASELLLGQPVYVKGFFLGNEFPANDNFSERLDDTTQIHLRYYSGQPLENFGGGQALTSWPFIVGWSQGTNYKAVQRDFFAYVKTFAQPAKLRLQYNSWYESFMGISEKRFIELAQAMHEQATAYHLPPIAAYVLDDGWNNYNDPTFTGIDPFRSGQTYNQSGFWEFNDKFPHEATAINAYLQNLGTTLGLWLGPQGGYELQDTFARYLEARGHGKINFQAALGEALDVNDEVYLKKLACLLLDYQQKFQLSYWKFDGFASRPSLRTDAGHLVGGPKNRYYTTQLWERWLVILGQLKAQNPDVFINLTSYVPPSPWFLRVANALWLQNSGDYERDLHAPGSQAQQAITGRDEIYFKKVFAEKLQLPLCYFYNHEPIYGTALDNEMSDDDFQATLLANAMRGPALWELHLSPQLLNAEKWQILAEVLNWTQAHYDILQESRMFLPRESVLEGYGYVAQKNGHGFVYLRNPSATCQQYHLSEITARVVQLTEVYPSVTASFASTEVLTLRPLTYKIYQF